MIVQLAYCSREPGWWSKDKSQWLSYGALVLNGTVHYHLARSEDLILIHTKDWVGAGGSGDYHQLSASSPCHYDWMRVFKMDQHQAPITAQFLRKLSLA